MNIIEMLKVIGVDNIKFATIQSLLTGKQKQKKGYVEASIGLPGISLIDLVAKEPKDMAFLVTVPGEKVREIYARLKEEKQ